MALSSPWACAAFPVCIAAMISYQPVLAYGNGAPTGVCSSMTPGHGAEITTLSYAIDTGGAKTYSRNTPITVSITGGSYQGILLQARDNTGSPVGSFSTPPTNSKTLDCTSAASSITHSNTQTKTGVPYTWNPPETAAGDVYFIATVAETKTRWKKNIRSVTLSSTYGNSGSLIGAEFVLIVSALMTSLQILLWRPV